MKYICIRVCIKANKKVLKESVYSKFNFNRAVYSRINRLFVTHCICDNEEVNIASYPVKAQCLLHVPSAFLYGSNVFSTHRAFMCSVRFRQQRAILSPHIPNPLIFMT
jgi:hypothetical protein